MAAQDAALDALIVSSHFGLLDRLLPYLAYATQKGLENGARIAMHQDPIGVPPFAVYAGLDSQMVAVYKRSNEYNRALATGRVTGLAYVLAHEIGHQYDNDHGRVSDAEQRKREIEADDYALDLCVKAGLDPAGIVPLMALFREGGSDSTHPPPVCRLINFLFHGLPALLANNLPFQRAVAAHPETQRRISAFLSWARTDRANIVDSCGKWVLTNPAYK